MPDRVSMPLGRAPSGSRRWPLRLVLGAAMVMTVVLIVLSSRRTPRARAFELDVHIEILRSALTGRMSPEALDKVIGYFVDVAGKVIPLGGGNVGSDLHQLESQRHFDSAKNPADICERWDTGYNAFILAAVDNSRPVGDEKRALLDRDAALSSFGEATHAIADFYAHSNWVEIHANAGVRPPQAPILSAFCDPGAFPPALQTGYADLGAYIVNGGQSWCPDDGPPEGFTYCHDQLNKDSPEGEHGGAHPGPPGSTTFSAMETYHTLARQLAVEATAQAWEALHRRIVQTYDSDTVDGECVFHKLAFGGDESCLKIMRFHAEGMMSGASTGQLAGSSTSRYQDSVNVSFSVDFKILRSPDEYPGWATMTAEEQSLVRDAFAQGWNVTGTGTATITVSSQYDEPLTTPPFVPHCETHQTATVAVSVRGKEVRGGLSLAFGWNQAPQGTWYCTYSGQPITGGLAPIWPQMLIEVAAQDGAVAHLVEHNVRSFIGMGDRTWDLRLSVPRDPP